jgi:hypothetical protein
LPFKRNLQRYSTEDQEVLKGQNLQFAYILDRLYYERGIAEEAMKAERSLVTNMDADLVALKKHAREVKGAVEHSYVEKLGQREKLEAELDASEVKLHARRAEADRNRLIFLTEQDAYADWEKARKQKQQHAEIERKKRLSQVQEVHTLEMLMEKPHGERVFRKLCDAARCDPNVPQEILDVFLNIPTKKKTLKSSKAEAEQRIAALEERYKLVEKEERAVCSLLGGGRRGSGGGAATPAMDEAGAVQLLNIVVDP